MGLINKEELRKRVPTIKKEKVEVPEWGEDAFIYVRELSAAALDYFESFIVLDGSATSEEKRARYENFRVRYVVLSACDENGNAIFTDEDEAWLGQMEASVISKLFAAAKRVNLIDAKGLEKNS